MNRKLFYTSTALRPLHTYKSSKNFSNSSTIYLSLRIDLYTYKVSLSLPCLSMSPITARLCVILCSINVHPGTGCSKHVTSCADILRHLYVPYWLPNNDVVGLSDASDYGKVGNTGGDCYFHWKKTQFWFRIS